MVPDHCPFPFSPFPVHLPSPPSSASSCLQGNALARASGLLPPCLCASVPSPVPLCPSVPSSLPSVGILWKIGVHTPLFHGSVARHPAVR